MCLQIAESITDLGFPSEVLEGAGEGSMGKVEVQVLILALLFKTVYLLVLYCFCRSRA